MREVYLERRFTLGGGIIGHLTEGDIFLCYTLERPWSDNIPNVSAVPCGDYECRYEHSARFGMHLYELKDVPGRTECKFHSANWPYELAGCIAPGMDLGDTGMPLNQSAAALDMIHRRFEGAPFLLKIRQHALYIPEEQEIASLGVDE